MKLASRLAGSGWSPTQQWSHRRGKHNHAHRHASIRCSRSHLEINNKCLDLLVYIGKSKEAHVRAHQVEGMGLYPRLARKAIVQNQE